MNLIRHGIAVPACGLAIFFLAFGCTTKSEKPKAAATITTTSPTKPAAPAPTNPPPVAITPPLYVPDMSHTGNALSDTVLAWDALLKATDAAANQAEAHLTFNLTNISSGNVTIVSVHPSCGCTTAQLPPMPWTLNPNTTGQINLTVNLAGKRDTLFKTVTVTTDKGYKVLTLKIKILPPVVVAMTDEDRARGLAMAKVDRQAVFKNDCATCHLKPAEGKYGEALFVAACAICHEGEHRASMVPDLHTLKTPTNEQFWQVWIAHGKPGSLMPAFSATEGGPLNDLQIASLAAYLNVTIPSHVAPASQ